MSPRGSSVATPPGQSARNSSAPYSRRSSSQPKSSRQQFSACGACRMRRVRCDLKDLPIGFVGPHPACSNCKERGIKCVDEFADVKAVKLLRRGRRLQQVEAIYGKVGDQDGNSSSSNLSARSSAMPILHPDFFISPFWRWFSIQRPILDARDFASRFTAHCKGSEPLSNEAQLISMVLVIWAASFGLNERGFPENESSLDGRTSPDESRHPPESNAPHASSRRKYISLGSMRRQWKTKTESFIREILELIDVNGVLRRPTLDGVRLLLLLLPLLEEAQPLERLVMHEATLSQVQALCSVSANPSSNFEDAATRARIFWYAYSQESILTGIRGGRFVLHEEDLNLFQRTLPPSHLDVGSTSLPSPPSPSSIDIVPNIPPYHVGEPSNFGAQGTPSHKTFINLMRASSPPLELGNICRRIHDVLTGIKATRRAEDHGLIDANGMRDIWRSLDRCWQDLDLIKRTRQEHDDGLRRYEITQYVSAWQIFVFECHNVIRESLKHFASSSGSQVVYDPSSSSRPSSHSSNSSPYLEPQALHSAATRKCLALLPRILHILRIYATGDQNDTPGIFQCDAGLVRDGCFFAAYLAANFDGDFIEGSSEDKPNSIDTPLTVDEGVSICLTVLTSMRWSFSKSEEREETVKMIWENRKLRRQGQAHHLPLYDANYPHSLALSVPHLNLNIPASPHIGVTVTTSEDRPMLPPLSLFKSQRSTESAPNTACSTDDHGPNSWPSYTPPGTATSAATSTGTGLSRRGSPVFANMNTFKAMDDVFYQGGGEVDQFTYSVPLSGSIIRGNGGVVPNPPYGSRTSHMESQALATTTAANYMVTTSFHDPNSSLLTQADFHTCPQFGENCNGNYHGTL